MACDTFIKISIKCKTMFVELQMGEVMPFVDEILSTMPAIINDLQPHQVGLVVFATGCGTLTLCWADSHLLRGCWAHDLGAEQPAGTSGAHCQSHGDD